MIFMAYDKMHICILVELIVRQLTAVEKEFIVYLKVTAVLLLPPRLHGQLFPDVLPRVLPSTIVSKCLGAVSNLDKLLYNVVDVLREVASDEDLLGEGYASLGCLSPMTW